MFSIAFYSPISLFGVIVVCGRLVALLNLHGLRFVCEAMGSSDSRRQTREIVLVQLWQSC